MQPAQLHRKYEKKNPAPPPPNIPRGKEFSHVPNMGNSVSLHRERGKHLISEADGRFVSFCKARSYGALTHSLPLACSPRLRLSAPALRVLPHRHRLQVITSPPFLLFGLDLQNPNRQEGNVLADACAGGFQFLFRKFPAADLRFKFYRVQDQG